MNKHDLKQSSHINNNDNPINTLEEGLQISLSCKIQKIPKFYKEMKFIRKHLK